MNRRDFITLGAVGTLAAAAGCRTSWRGGAPLFERDVKAACPGAKVLPGFTTRGSYIGECFAAGSCKCLHYRSGSEI